jgi:hypothetical protein
MIHQPLPVLPVPAAGVARRSRRAGPGPAWPPPHGPLGTEARRGPERQTHPLPPPLRDPCDPGTHPGPGLPAHHHLPPPRGPLIYEPAAVGSGGPGCAAARSRRAGVRVIALLASVAALLLAAPAWAAPAWAAPAAPATGASGGWSSAGTDWRWPLPGRPEVVRGFDPPPLPWDSGHRGVDLAAAAGTRVLAAGAGTVSYAGVLAGRGVVAIRHAGGLRTTYEPVVVTATVGQVVAAGDVIGLLAAGHPGCPRPACLHWGLLRGDTYLDPLSLLRGGPIRLLPLSGAGPPPAAPPVPPAAAFAPTPPRSETAPSTGDRAAAESTGSATLRSQRTAATIGLALAGALALARRRPP